MSLPGLMGKIFSIVLREYRLFMGDRDIIRGEKSWGMYVDIKYYIFKKEKARLVLKRRFVCKYRINLLVWGSNFDLDFISSLKINGFPIGNFLSKKEKFT